jgi:diacylglycerol O-acyltransferase
VSGRADGGCRGGDLAVGAEGEPGLGPGACVGRIGTVRSVLTRLRVDELVNAWVGDRDTPFQIALIGVFDSGPFRRPDGSVDVPRIRNELAARARCVAPLGRRMIRTVPGEGRPWWADDPGYDPAEHIEAVRPPSGVPWPTWAANRVVRPLVPDRPLWRAEVVDGLPDDGFAVIIVVHHLVADGLAGMTLAASLLDAGPDVVVPVVPATSAVGALPSHRDLVRAQLVDLGAGLRRVLPGNRRAEDSSRHRPSPRELREAMAGFRTQLPATSLPRTVGPGRRMAVVCARCCRRVAKTSRGWCCARRFRRPPAGPVRCSACSSWTCRWGSRTRRGAWR